MRFYLSIILIMMQTAALSQEEPEEALLQVTYQAVTRARQITITASQDSLHYLAYEASEKQEYSRSMADSTFALLHKTVSKLDLTTLDSLKAPTNTRQYDGDWYASVKITTTRGIYQTQDFDKKCPMSEIKPVIDFFEEALKINLYSKDDKRCE